MNIAWYTHYFTHEIAAPSARIYELSQSWVNAGHHVQVVTCFPNHPTGKLYPGYNRDFYTYEEMNGIDVHRHWTYITPNKGFVKKTFGHVSYLPSTFIWSNRHLIRPDVVIGSSPTFFAAMAAAGTGIQKKVPFIMEIRDLWPAIFIELGVLKNPFMIRLLEYMELALYNKAVHTITVTEAFRKNLIIRGVPPAKVTTVTNGADVEFWQPCESSVALRRRLGLESCFVVLYIGAHGISHALGRILESAERLQDYPDIYFLFIGEGAEKGQLTSKVQEARLQNVRFLEPVGKERVKEFYALSDVCLVPLRDIPLFETFIPSKMFEIMAMGRPIIGSVRGEAADILRRSKAALVVEPEDGESIAQAILQIYNNPKKAATMGKSARQFVVGNYSRDYLASLYLQAINEAVQKSWGHH